MIMESCLNEEIIDHDIVINAYMNMFMAKNGLENKNDVFLFLASMNLLNAYVKKDYAVDEIKKNYKFKKVISKALEDIIIGNIEGVNVYYTPEVVYISVYNYQFSFHNVVATQILKKYMLSPKNIEQEWKGIRLQTIALSIYKEAKELIKL